MTLKNRERERRNVALPCNEIKFILALPPPAVPVASTSSGSKVGHSIAFPFRTTLVAILMMVQWTDGFQFTRRIASRWMLPQRRIPIQRVPPRSKPFIGVTARFDSDGHVDTQHSYAPNVTITRNGVQILNEHQLFNKISSSSSSMSTLSTVAAIADVPRPTDNGGFTHTIASKAKISAANKGKRPWNKGRQTTEEERARIAAGVRATNRERFLRKLEELGLGEEEYEEQKRAERRKKDAERRARKTENGGYTPTLETRQKISQVLKEKHARGEIRRRRTDPDKVRRGFVHSEETKRKISESLKKRWSNDVEYRVSMQNKTFAINSRNDVRQRISETLKEKWQNPEFREKMMIRMSGRNTKQTLELSHREKISEAMKLRWQDSDYRTKVTNSIAKRSEREMSKSWPLTPAKPKTTSDPTTRRNVEAAGSDPKAKRKKPETFIKTSAMHEAFDGPSSPRSYEEKGKSPPLLVIDHPSSTSKPKLERFKEEDVEALEITPLQPLQRSRSPIRTHKTTESSSKRVGSTYIPSNAGISAPIAAAMDEGIVNEWTPSNGSSSTGRQDEKGSVARLREERRDLYDLLYGDENVMVNSNLGGVFELDDDNLDNFDPYGLDDF